MRVVALLLAVMAAAPSGARADVEAGRKKAELCVTCHKPDNPSVPFMVALDGQKRDYLYNQLKAYKDKRRTDPAMLINVSNLSDEDMRDIADHFAAQRPARAAFALQAERVARGKAWAAAGACASCHQADYAGHMAVPRLAGMAPRYLSWQLVMFSSEGRGHPRINRANAITGADADDLADYFAQLD